MTSERMELNKFAYFPPPPSKKQLESALCIIFKMNAENQQFSFSFFLSSFFLKDLVLLLLFLFKVENYIKCKALNKEAVIKPK